MTHYSKEVEHGWRNLLSNLSDDLWQTVRRLGRNPAFALVVLLTLAVAIGANTALFTVAYTVLLKPLPYPESDRLVAVWHTAPGINIPKLDASPATTFLYQDEGRTFERIGMWNDAAATVTGNEKPEQVRIIRTTEGTLPVLGIKPLLGRWFMSDDDTPGNPETVILSYGYWRSRFGGDAGIIGKRLLIDGKPHDVIGIMPERFRFVEADPALIVPLQIDRKRLLIGNFSFRSVARLKPNVTVEQANADVARMLSFITERFPPPEGMNKKMIEEVRLGPSILPLAQDVVGDVGKVIWILMATVGMVLLIACANVANLTLLRADGRQQELAIRSALGAGRGRIARDLLTESLTLGILGGVLGLGVAQGALELLIWLAPSTLPRLGEINLDHVSLAFTLLLSLVAGLAFGLVPVLKYAAPSIAVTIRSGGRTASATRERHRTRHSLVVVQVCLALVLLIGASLMIRSLRSMLNVNPGFAAPEQVLTFRIAIPEAEAKEPERVPQLFAQMLERLRAVPSVTAAAGITSVTMDGRTSNDPIFIEGQDSAPSTIPPMRRYKYITPETFVTMGNPMIAGRDLKWEDIHEKRPVVLVSENLAQELWGSARAALGKRIRRSSNDLGREIIGVVGNERDDGVDRPAPTVVYFPMIHNNAPGSGVNLQRALTITVRSERVGMQGFLEEVQEAVWSVNRNLPLAEVRTLEEIYRRSMARTTFMLVMLSIASAMALLLGIVGIYGVIAYTVSQNTREIGIRLALGAQPREVRRMFARRGVMLAAIGVTLGLFVAVPMAKLLGSLLYGVSPLDPVTYTAVPALLLAIALLAAWISTRRASHIEPVEVLRGE